MKTQIAITKDHKKRLEQANGGDFQAGIDNAIRVYLMALRMKEEGHKVASVYGNSIDFYEEIPLP